LVLDHTLGGIREELESSGFRVISIERNMKTESERTAILSGRILVTNTCCHYRSDAVGMEFDIICAEQLLDMDAITMAKTIDKAFKTHNLWIFPQIFLLHLKRNELHELEYLSP
jgi:hypothetical protein